MAAYTTIDNPELYFQADLYTGNGSNGNAKTFDGDEDMQPNVVWIKSRSAAENQHIFDSIRGANKRLLTNTTGTEFDDSSNLQSFDSNGFTLGTADGINKNNATFVAWCWKESATAGFDILTFEGNGTDDTDISHNLSAVPHWIICRNFDAAKDWCVYHHKNTSAPETDLLVLNTNAATTDSDDKWSDEAPTSSVFTVGDSSQLNASGDTSIAFLWSEKQGYSKFGTYEGNNNASGPYIFLGFKPAWFMTKKSNGTKDWNIYDNKRSDSGGGNPNDQYVEANTNAAEQSGQDVDFLSTGVKIRSTSNEVNGDDNDFIYIAFAESPIVNSNGVPNKAE